MAYVYVLPNACIELKAIFNHMGTHLIKAQLFISLQFFQTYLCIRPVWYPSMENITCVLQSQFLSLWRDHVYIIVYMNSYICDGLHSFNQFCAKLDNLWKITMVREM